MSEHYTPEVPSARLSFQDTNILFASDRENSDGGAGSSLSRKAVALRGWGNVSVQKRPERRGAFDLATISAAERCCVHSQKRAYGGSLVDLVKTKSLLTQRGHQQVPGNYQETRHS